MKYEPDDFEPTKIDELIESNEPAKKEEPAENSDLAAKEEPQANNEPVKNNEPTVDDESLENDEPSENNDSSENDEPAHNNGIVDNEHKVTPRTELVKHRNSIKEIIENSNATPIRRYGGIGYTCCYCDDQFEEPADLKKHTLDTHDDIAEANFMKSMNMSEYVVKLDITDLKCKLCDTNIDNLKIFVDHLQKIHQKNTLLEYISHIFPVKFEGDMLKCIQCLNTFSKFRMLVRHMHIHYRNHICKICDAGFVNRNALTQHLVNHKSGSYVCDYCPKTFTNQVRKRLHERTAHTHVESMNKCGYCQKCFKDYRQKEAHVIATHGVAQPKLFCQACNKEFNNRKSLNTHVKRDHLMERSHKCKECDMTFYSTTGLKNHMVKHTGLKEFQCAVCLKSYGRKKTLNAHMRIHEKEKQYKCEICKQEFTQKCSWRGHMRNKHGEIV